jgi:phosphate-selective porin OprO/OprP
MELSKLPNIVILGRIYVFLDANAQESNAPKFEKGLFNLIGQGSTWFAKISLNFQTLATSNWNVNNGLSNPESSMLIRRSRLKFDGFAFSTKLKYKVELGLSNRNQSGAAKYAGNAP